MWQHSISSLETGEGVSMMMERVKEASKTSAETIAEACVMLVTDETSRLVSGKYVNLEQDIDGILGDLGKGKDSKSVRGNLYRLKVESLQ
jgi:hypothetical protein